MSRKDKIIGASYMVAICLGAIIWVAVMYRIGWALICQLFGIPLHPSQDSLAVGHFLAGLTWVLALVTPAVVIALWADS